MCSIALALGLLRQRSLDDAVLAIHLQVQRDITGFLQRLGESFLPIVIIRPGRSQPASYGCPLSTHSQHSVPQCNSNQAFYAVFLLSNGLVIGVHDCAS